MLLAISHTPETGTVIEGVGREGPVVDILRDCGWCWDTSLQCWSLPGSRGCDASIGIIACTTGALTRADHQVITGIGHCHPGRCTTTAASRR